MKAKVYNISEKNGNMVFAIGRKTKTTNYHFGSIEVNSTDKVVEIHIHKPFEKGLTVNDKLEIINNWISGQSFVSNENTIIGVKINKYDKNTNQHIKTLISLSNFNIEQYDTSTRKNRYW